MNSQVTSAPEPRHLFSANLDFLRSCAVFCVLLSHLYETLVHRHSSSSMHFGQLGVIFFFVHTSLVLMKSLSRMRSQGTSMFSEFYILRIFRIYPFSMVCVVIAFLIPGSHWTMWEFFSNLTLTMNLTYTNTMVGGLWSLPLEVQMYIMLPVIFIALRNRPVWMTMAVAIFCIPIALALPHFTHRLETIEYMPCFFGGIIAWRIGQQPRAPGFLFPVAVLLCASPWLFSAGNEMWPRWISCLMLGICIPYFAEITNRYVVVISKNIAKYSFGIYLTHPVALKLAFDTGASHDMTYRYLIFFALATLMPILAFHLVEDPAIRFSKYLLTNFREMPVTVSKAG